MLNALKKIGHFAGEEQGNIRKSIAVSFLFAIFYMFQIGAVYFVILGMLGKDIGINPALLALLFLLISIFGRALTNYFAQLEQTHAGYFMVARQRLAVANKMKTVPMGYFDEANTGNIVGTLTTVLGDVENTAPVVLINIMGGFLNAFVFTLITLIWDWRIGLIVIVGTLIYLWVTSAMEKKTAHLAPKRQEAQAELVEAVLEQIKGMSIIKSFNLTGKGDKKVHAAIRRNKKTNLAIEKMFTPYNMAQDFVLKLFSILIIVVAIYLYVQGTMLPENALMSVIISFMIFAQIDSAGSSMAVLRVVSSSIDQVENLKQMPVMDIHGEDIRPKKASIKVANIDFSYGSKEILHDVSFTVPEKTTTAIVGPSGSGKTTVCNLIARFWDVNAGSIKIGGHDIRDYTLTSLMDQISMVFQSVYLFQDTIENNIKFGNMNATHEEVVQAAQKAACHDFIMSLPEGYKTVIGEGGASLSGGEKQRISIARALLKDAPIIIFDEATANVDPENEDKLQQAMNSLMKDKTIIMIAHRLKTVENADQILVIDEGKVVASGTHNELAAKDGIYSRFLQARKTAESWKI